jgi:uracil-DNA glycosylase family 4
MRSWLDGDPGGTSDWSTAVTAHGTGSDEDRYSVNGQSTLPHPLSRLAAEIVTCRLCPRLVAWRERVAVEKVARFARDTYWGRPLPGFGDPDARVFVLGLAPAAHGGNRTGRIFTGDRSGDFLCSALYATGFANQPTSVGVEDGLVLTDAYLAAAVRCAPPENRPTTVERDNCSPYLVRELAALARVRVVVALGAFAWDAVLRAIPSGHATSLARPRPKFGHAAETAIGQYQLIGSFHPSQRNTFTGRLSPPMLEAILLRAGELARTEDRCAQTRVPN